MTFLKEVWEVVVIYLDWCLLINPQLTFLIMFFVLIIVPGKFVAFIYKLCSKKKVFGLMASILPIFVGIQYFLYVRHQFLISNKEEFISYWGIFQKLVYFLKTDNFWWNLYLCDFFWFLENILLILILMLTFRLNCLMISLVITWIDFIANRFYEYFFNLYILIYMWLKNYWLSLLFLINIIFISLGIYLIMIYLMKLAYIIITTILFNLAGIMAYIIGTIILEVMNNTLPCFIIFFIILIYFDIDLKNEIKKLWTSIK